MCTKLLTEISLRPVTMSDAESILTWRNAPETQKYSFNKDTISLKTHQQWLSQFLQKNNKCLLIGEVDNKPIGVLRYDFVNETGEVSIYLVPGMQGNGLGPKLLNAGSRWVKLNFPHVKQIIAKVIEENIASHKAFTKAGFDKYYSVYELFL